MSTEKLAHTTCLPFRRCLLTGADGFVGSLFAPALRARLGGGAQLWRAIRGDVDSGDVIPLDLTDRASVQVAVDRVRPDLVIHLAGQSSVAGSLTSGAATWTVNLQGTMALAEAVGVSPDTTFLFASSAEVYGATFNDGVAREDSPLRPTSAYARSKAAAEQMLADVLPATARLIVCRAANHTGPGQTTSFVVPSFAAQIVAAEVGDGRIKVGALDSRRDFLAAHDVVRAYLTLLERAADLPMRSTYNIASGSETRVGDLLDRLLSMANREIIAEQDPDRMRQSEVPRARIDTAAIRTLGWSPQTSLDDVLKEVLIDQRRLFALTKLS